MLARVLLACGLFLASAYAPNVQADAGSEAFAHLHRVATSPRCVNCHGAAINNQFVPLNGDDGHAHAMNVTGNLSELGARCTSCHQRTNTELAGGPPGAANTAMPDFLWHMPPQVMMLSRTISAKALCEQWVDPARNSVPPGGRGSLEDLPKLRAEFTHHFRDDPLIHWTFAPGGDRTPAPGNKEQLLEAVTTWIGWLEQGKTCNDL